MEFYEEGGVFLLDEVDAADANVLLVINQALANGHLPVPNRTDTRGVLVMRNMPTPDQTELVSRIMPRVHRLCIDRSGMGVPIFETMERAFYQARLAGQNGGRELETAGRC